MAEVERKTERRQHDRYQVGRQAITMLWPASSIVGRIVDISMDGLAFRYSAQKNPQDNSSDIEVILPQDSFSTGMLPFTTVTDFKSPGFFSVLIGKQGRRRNVQFRPLSKEQRAKLASFIEKYCWKVPE
jgi:hypothetical protein